MYTDQFKTKESLTYYAFDILKSIATRIYNLKYDEYRRLGYRLRNKKKKK